MMLLLAGSFACRVSLTRSPRCGGSPCRSVFVCGRAACCKRLCARARPQPQGDATGDIIQHFRRFSSHSAAPLLSPFHRTYTPAHGTTHTTRTRTPWHPGSRPRDSTTPTRTPHTRRHSPPPALCHPVPALLAHTHAAGKRHVADCHFSSLLCPALVHQIRRHLALDALVSLLVRTVLQHASLFLVATPAHSQCRTGTERQITQS